MRTSDSLITEASLEPGGALRLVRTCDRPTLVVTAPEPWATLQPDAAPTIEARKSPGVALDALEAFAAAVPSVDQVVGIGGGTALDTAKFVAWRRGWPLTLVPSILSVDAAFTNTVGVRVAGHVEYRGDVRPDRVIVDPDLIRTAPPHLNRAGIGDLLSCHTALCDWRIAEEDGHPAGPRVKWDAELAHLAEDILSAVSGHAADVGAVNDTGVALLANGFRRVGDACVRAGHARFEEGSEHFFAYALEAHTQRTYVHGEVIAFGTVVMAVAQANAADRVAEIIRRTRVRAEPAHLGIDEALCVTVLANLGEYVRRQNHWWSVVDRTTFTEREAHAVWTDTCRLLAGR